MSRILATKGTEVEKPVDYSTLTVKELQKRIKDYETKFGGFAKFLRGYDCESAAPDDYQTLIDWKCFLNELKGRRGAGLSLVKGGKSKPY
ncbi:MAG: hypothetical protein EXR70_12850 [Deltaproteobacteria bacterium]|nr:hypothetical protein [Deltaproteobacteria bacterium]